MKQRIFSEVLIVPNCFRTVIKNTGISRFYSVCVKDIYDLEEIRRGEACNSFREKDYNHTFTRVWRVVDRELFYHQKPCKNVIHRHGRYLIIECFTTYSDIYNMSNTLSNDRYNVKDLLFHLLELHSKIK